jgi:pyruvate dehydrogenase E1 component alpha subunit
MNIQEVYDAYIDASEFVRSGNGPFILEMKTYRYRGHSMSDPAKYRAKEEVETYKSMDPIESLEKILIEKKYTTQEDLKIIQNKIKLHIQEIVDFAQNSQEPSEDELYKDVYK